MQVEVKNVSGKAVKTIDLPDSIYAVEMNDHVLHSVVKSYRSNRRQGTCATKTRSLVSGGGKKPFRQKGTGNARQGSSRSPLNPGGAVAHGPQPRDHTQKINRNLKKLAMKIVLSDKLKHGKLVVVDDFSISNYSTKHILSVLKNLEVQSGLLSDERKDDFLFKSTRNILGATSKTPLEINTEDLLRYEAFVISENGLNALHQRIEGSSHASL